MKVFLSILFLFQLTACVKVTDIDNDKNNGKVQPQEVTLMEPAIDVSEEANSYQVRLPFPSDALFAQRFEKNDPSSLQVIPLNLRKGILTDLKPRPGAEYVYQIGSIQNGSFQELRRYEISVPEDKLVDGEIILTQDESWTQYRRIILTDRGVITTLDHRLTIEADELISNQGEIRTFPDGSISSSGAGRSGNNITVSVRSGKGHLKISMRGENGAHGLSGGPFVGPPAQPTIHHSRNLIPIIVWPPERAGKNGSDGQAGGSSGAFEMRIQENHPMTFAPVLREGKGGNRGEGGAGESPHPGRTQPGPKGNDGLPGADGAIQRICIEDFRKQACLQ